MGNFLSALVQRGVQAAGGAMRGQKEGRDRVAAEARQAEEDALQRAMVEARMGTERRQQEALDRQAQDFVPHAQRVSEALAEINARRDAQLAIERLRGQNAARTAGVVRHTGRTGGGRSDPRVGVIGSTISRLQRDRAADLKASTDAMGRIRNPAAADSAASRATARADSIGTLEAERRRIVGLGGEAAEGAGAEPDQNTDDLLSAKTPQQWVDEVSAEHPEWDDNRIIAEAQRRAGGN